MIGKNSSIILFVMLLVLAISPVRAFAAAWADVVYDADVPPKTRENVAKAIDSVADLLTQYNIALRDNITVVVTSDTEGYIQARMFYAKESRGKAEEGAKYSGGVSLGDKRIIIIRGSLQLNSNPAEAFRILPHEIFHQVQNQYGKTGTVNWLVEGTPEAFQFTAREKAGFGKGSDYVRQAEEIIRHAPEIPDVRQLADYKYQNYTALVQKGYPVYQMSVVMTNRLVQDNGFENIIFFYQLLHNGTTPDKAFLAAFRVPMAWFLSDMNDYFDKLRGGR